MGAMSRRKGATGERDIARRWRSDLWPDARRGIGQARAGGEVPDIDGTPFWVEVKRQKRPNIKAALEQAEAAVADANDERAPLVVARWDGMSEGDSIVALRLSDFEALIRAHREGFEAP